MAARKDIFAGPYIGGDREDFERPARKRDIMLFARLHPLPWDRPNVFFKVDLGPSRAECFACSGRREDREFKRQRPYALLLAETSDKCRNLFVGQGRVMAARILVTLG
jgi:hypothetical protein